MSDERKYISEFGLNMICSGSALLQQQHLGDLPEGFEPRIYLITRRPRISLDPKSVKITSTNVSGNFKKQVQDSSILIPFDVPNMLGTDQLTLRCDYPYTEYAFLDKDGRAIADGQSALLLSAFGSQFWSHLDLEVLYVGQAYGKDGARTAADRLQKHETLQAIYSESLRRNPDQDIWLLLCSFEPLLLMSFDSHSKKIHSSLEEDTAHLHKAIREEVTEQQRINFTEAALIRYFQPPYNKIYKDSFPNPMHSTYSECYDLDLNAVCVEFPTEELRLRLYSVSTQPAWTHLCSFALHSREERVYMFDF